MYEGGVELVAEDHVTLINPKVTELPVMTPGAYVGWALAGEKKCAALMTIMRTNIVLREDFFANFLKDCPLLT